VITDSAREIVPILRHEPTTSALIAPCRSAEPNGHRARLRPPQPDDPPPAAIHLGERELVSGALGHAPVPDLASHVPGYANRDDFLRGARDGRVDRSVHGFAIDRIDAEEREPEIREALKQPVKFRLVSNGSHEHRVPMVMRQAHPLEQPSELITQLALGLEPVGSDSHHHTVAQAGPSYATVATITQVIAFLPGGSVRSRERLRLGAN
jgi:hypothetical protein